MALADSDGSPDGDAQLIVLRVVIRSPDVETFVAKYSRFLKDDRIFIFTKASQPPGTRVRFTLELADGPRLLHGEGTVTRIRADKGDASKPPGMELRFAPLDEASREMVTRMLNARGGSETAPLPPSPRNAENVEIPSAPVTQGVMEDVSTQIRTQMSGIVEPANGRASSDSFALQTGTNPGSMPGERGEPTDVDSGTESRKFNALPPAFTATPTPLPAPLPLPTMITPTQGTVLPEARARSQPDGQEIYAPAKVTQPVLPALDSTPPLGVAKSARGDEATGAFPTVEAPPRVAESWCGPLPPPPGAPPAVGSTVPANPFSEVSDGAIEYFIEWSLEQSTAAHPKNKPPSAASFANVPMKPPRAEPDSQASARRVRLFVGILVGVVLGLPLGATAMWAWGPMIFVPDETPAAPAHAHGPLERIRARLAAPPPADPAAVPVPAPAPPPAKPPEAALQPEPAKPPAPVAAKPPEPAAEKPEGSAPGPKELPPPPSLGNPRSSIKTATLRVSSVPPGAEVTIKGDSYGKTPVDVELSPNHRYDVQIVMAGRKPWKRRINLAPPVTEVTAVLK